MGLLVAEVPAVSSQVVIGRPAQTLVVLEAEVLDLKVWLVRSRPGSC